MGPVRYAWKIVVSFKIFHCFRVYIKSCLVVEDFSKALLSIVLWYMV